MKKVEIEPRRGASLRLEVGQQLKVVDVAGGQVADLFAINQSDDSEYLSAQHTRATTSHLFPAVGDDFVTNRRRPILRLVADDSPGIHDMLIAAYRTYRERTDALASTPESNRVPGCRDSR